MNLLIETTCNQTCDFCFQRDVFADRSQMQLEEVRALVPFLRQSGHRTIGVLGGEPTLHRDLPKILAELVAGGLEPLLFTNALCAPDRLTESLAYVHSVLVNLRPPSSYTRRQAALIETSCAAIQQERARRRAIGEELGFDIGTTLVEVGQDLSYLIRAAQELAVRSVRWDLSKPSPGGQNRYMDPFAPGVGAWIVELVRQFAAVGIRTSVDCPVPYCLFTPSEIEFLESAVLRFRGVCEPPIDILPGGVAVHCFPLADVVDPLAIEEVGDFASLNGFLQLGVRRTLFRELLPETCRACHWFEEQRCQGYCPSYWRALEAQA